MPARPPRWDDDRLERDRQVAIEQFRAERMGESLDAYRRAFARQREVVERLFRASADLSAFADRASSILTDGELLYAARYLAGPPVSEDDLEVLADMRLAPTRLSAHADGARRVAETILRGLDRERFPWLGETREPTAGERHAAVTATAALLASQLVRTSRMNEAPRRQEALVKARLSGADFVEAPARPIPNLSAAPDMGRFTGECVVGASRKADVVVRLWDGRVMPIECKVSNSEVNSIKRLTNDAAVKARVWIEDLGRNNVVPAAVLSGVFGLAHLVEARERGLTLFWAHSLDELLAFIEASR